MNLKNYIHEHRLSLVFPSVFVLFLISAPFCKEKNTSKSPESDKSKYIFRSGFLWGVATSGFQTDMGPGVEPDTRSDWWKWFHDAENERKRFVPSDDKPENGPAFWKFFKEDIERAKDFLNLNAFRYSIEWSRIFPEPTWEAKTVSDLDDFANQDAVKKYREILSAIREKGLTPYITLNHFTLPIWIHDPLCEGENCPLGWLDRRTSYEFAKYCVFIARKFGDLIDLWDTFNEPIVVSTLGYLAGIAGAFAGAGAFPPAKISPSDFVTATLNLIYAHALCYDEIKKYDNYDSDGDGINSLVSIIYNINWFEAFSEDDMEATEHAWFWQVW